VQYILDEVLSYQEYAKQFGTTVYQCLPHGLLTENSIKYKNMLLKYHYKHHVKYKYFNVQLMHNYITRRYN